MNGFLISALIATILYSVVKFFQMRFVNKENKPLKELISDSCIVFLVTLVGLFASDHIGSVDGISQALGMQSGGGGGDSSYVKAFVGKANF
jgi:hypothetical protein